MSSTLHSRRLLMLGQARPDTGFGRVIRAIASSLSGVFDVHVLALNVRAPESIVDGWTFHPNRGEWDVYADEALESLIRSLDPDVVLIINDIWLVNMFAPRIRELSRRAAVIGYSPVDGRILNPAIVSRLSYLDGFAAYNRFGLDEVRESTGNLTVPDIPMMVIPHGVDTDLFHPFNCATNSIPEPPDRAAARRALFGPETDLADSFLILNANRNQPRKRIDLTVEGFAIFVRDKPRNVRLLLHTAAQSEPQATDLLRLAEAFGIGDRIVGTNPGREHPAVSDSVLNLVYNACEVGLNTSMGEGWGLVSFEHAATGAAQIVPRHSSCEELWKSTAEFLEPVATQRISIAMEGKEVSAAEVATCLDRLYTDPTRLKRASLAAFANATRPEYSWTRIGQQWHNFIETVLTDKHGKAGSEFSNPSFPCSSVANFR